MGAEFDSTTLHTLCDEIRGKAIEVIELSRAV